MHVTIRVAHVLVFVMSCCCASLTTSRMPNACFTAAPILLDSGWLGRNMLTGEMLTERALFDLCGIQFANHTNVKLLFTYPD